MRYLVQLVIPALIFAGVLWALTRQRRRYRVEPADSSDTAAFLVILLVSAAVALGTAALIYAMAE